MSPRIKPVIAFSIIILLAIIVAGAFKLLGRDNVEINPPKFGPGGMPIQTFEECVAVGNPVMEIYPPQCRTKDGQSFTQQLERKDTCGNGACENVACMSIGCPEPETPENCPIDCKEVSISDLSDWQTYRNEKYGLEAKYPIGYISSISSTRTPLEINRVIFRKGNESEFWIRIIDKEFETEFFYQSSGNTVKLEEILVGSKKWYKLPPSDGGAGESIFATSLKTKTIQVVFPSCSEDWRDRPGVDDDKCGNPLYKDTESQNLILSTFKFIN